MILFKFMPDYLRADASVLSVIKLLFSTTLSFLQFPPRYFVPYLSFRSLLLFYHKKLKILALFMQLFLLLANLMVPFFVNTEILSILFQILFLLPRM